MSDGPEAGGVPDERAGPRLAAPPRRARPPSPSGPLERTRALGGGGHRARFGHRHARCDRRRHRAALHRPRLPRRCRHPAVGRHRATRSRWPPSCSSAARSATATGASGSSPSGSSGSPSRRPSAASRRRRRSSSPPACCRAIGGALLAPASLAILQASFRPDDRARAIGAWSGLGGVAAAAGPLVGGYLLAVGSWRWVFFINLPVAAAVLVITARHVPESRDPTPTGRVDTVGATLAVVFLAGLTYGLIEAPTRGWSSPAVVVCLVVAAVAAPAFLVVEHRRAQPDAPARASSAPASSAAPTASPSSSTAPSAVPSSCSPSSCRSSRATARSSPASRCSR